MLLQTGNIQVSVIGLYGFHPGIPGSIELNESLLRAVFSVMGTHLPTIIAGDLNVPIEQLGCWVAA